MNIELFYKSLEFVYTIKLFSSKYLVSLDSLRDTVLFIVDKCPPESLKEKREEMLESFCKMKNKWEASQA